MQLIGKGALTIYRIEGFFIAYSSPTITSPWEGTKGQLGYGGNVRNG